MNKYKLERSPPLNPLQILSARSARDGRRFRSGNLELSLSSGRRHAGGNITVCSSSGDILAIELAEEISVGLVKGARAAESVHLTNTAKVVGASLVRRLGRRSESLAIDGVLNNSGNVLEDVSFSKNIATLTDLKGVAGVVLPVVVDGVQQGVTLDLRATAASLVDVVTLHGNHVIRSIEVDTPVVVSVAGSGVVGFTVDEGVADCHAVVGLGAEDNVLATNAGGLFCLRVS